MKIEKRRKIKRIITIIIIIISISLSICLLYLYFFKNTKFSLKEKVFEVQISNSYDLKNYIKLSNLKIDDLVITSSNENIVDIENGNIITKDKVGKALIKVGYKDKLDSFIIDVKSNDLVCDYNFEDIAVYEESNKKGFSIDTKCDNLNVTYNDNIKIELSFNNNLNDVYGTIKVNNNIVDSKKLNITNKGIIYILKIDNIYVIDMVGSMSQCDYIGNIIIINENGNIIANTTNSYLTEKEISDLDLIPNFSYFRKMYYDVNRRAVIERINNCPINIVDCEDESILDKKIYINSAYSTNNNYLKNLYTRNETVKEYCERKDTNE